VSVSDNGIGIAADMLPRIFEMFTQVDSGGELGGLGIGLALARQLVTMHGGQIDATSEGLGKGSAFEVELPALDAAPELRTGETGATASGAARHRRILVVDDNQDAALSLSMLLELAHAQVRVAFDGQQAIEVAEAFRPQLILLDLGLPRMSGYDVVQWLRQREWGRSIAVVALTGWGQDGDRRRTREAGFDYHLVKPVSPEDLMEVLLRFAPEG
jgi:CheY-like chemotaxis protein